MLDSPVVVEQEDFGVGNDGGAAMVRKVPVRQLARIASSSPRQGRMLFRLAQWLKPARVLELGTGVGIGTLYLAAAARNARIITLEGSAACAHVAHTNLEILGLDKNVQIRTGPFSHTLGPALRELGKVDLVFIDGHHQQKAVLEYMEQCRPFLHAGSLVVLDNLYWSAGMTSAWEQLLQEPSVRLALDVFELGVLSFNPDIRVSQQYRLVPVRWKPWKQWGL